MENTQFAAAGVCLLLASSVLFAVSEAPTGVPLGLAAVAAVGGLAVAARVVRSRLRHRRPV